MGERTQRRSLDWDMQSTLAYFDDHFRGQALEVIAVMRGVRSQGSVKQLGCGYWSG
jgi:hypothetical protein